MILKLQCDSVTSDDLDLVWRFFFFFVKFLFKKKIIFLVEAKSSRHSSLITSYSFSFFVESH
jgi:hypothetical protein